MRLQRTAALSAATAATAATAAALAGPVTPADGASALPRTTMTATVRDLGTLGGPRSSATDIHATVVVGSSLLPDGLSTHAFAYDLRGSTMRDLGTLGGRNSDAVAIDGTIVTGTSDTADGKRHAFAYDLATSTMHDVGSLVAGGTSEATAVDDGVVVGQSGPTVGQGHAFAYDVASATLRDLGDLGLGQSRAVDVDGGSVVADALSTTTWQRQAFVYDLSTSTVRPFTSPAHTGGVPVDLSGSIAVGNAPRPVAFAYDLGTSTGVDLEGPHTRVPTVAAVEGTRAAGSVGDEFAGYLVTWDLASGRVGRDRGSLGGGGLQVSAMSGGVVVGSAGRAGDDRMRPFAFDLDAARPWMTDLGTVGGTSGDARAVSARTVVGWSSDRHHHSHATAWTLRTTSAPSFRFARTKAVVQENAGRARFTVLRDGSAARAASVRYVVRRPWSGGAVLASGTLRFAAGQTSRTLHAPVRDDTRRESWDRWAVVLRSPSSGAVLGSPHSAALVVRKSDQRPDGWISTSIGSSYLGKNVYNSTGARQTRTVSAPRGRTRTFYVQVQNDGNTDNDFVVRGSAARAGSKVHYYYQGSDVTGRLRASGGWRVHLDRDGLLSLEVRITPTGSAAVGSLKTASVRATWRGDGTRTDLVRAVVRVRR